MLININHGQSVPTRSISTDSSNLVSASVLLSIKPLHFKLSLVKQVSHTWTKFWWKTYVKCNSRFTFSFIILHLEHQRWRKRDQYISQLTLFTFSNEYLINFYGNPFIHLLNANLPDYRRGFFLNFYKLSFIVLLCNPNLRILIAFYLCLTIILWLIMLSEGGIVKNSLRPPIPEHCDPEWRKLMEQCWSPDPEIRPSFTEITNRLRSMSIVLQSKGIVRWGMRSPMFPHQLIV